MRRRIAASIPSPVRDEISVANEKRPSFCPPHQGRDRRKWHSRRASLVSFLNGLNFPEFNLNDSLIFQSPHDLGVAELVYY